MATNGTVGESSRASSANDWTELERQFFAAAPPEVAVQPPPPPTFEDLDPEAPHPIALPPSRRRITASRQSRRHERQSRGLACGPVFFRRLARTAWELARPASARAWRWAVARASAEARHLAPRLRATRDRTLERMKRGLDALASRVANDLPERPDGKTIVAAMAALIVLFGVSATVLGSRSDARLPPAPTTIVNPLLPREAATSPAARTVSIPEAVPIPR
jgi:hypothetical protein